MKVNFRPLLFFVFCFWSLTSHAIEVKVQVVDPAAKPLENIVVYLEPLDGQQQAKTGKTLDIGQVNKTFTPYISVMQSGNTVRFYNQDDITHHIYSVTGSHKFSIKIRSGEQMLKQDFTQAGEVVMGCNIHDWMSGYLLVLDTPYFDKTDSQGQLVLDVAEPGQYRLTAWHPQMQEKDNRLVKTFALPENQSIIFKLNQTMAEIPQQQSDDDFYFLSEY
ncbi:hypothetical protein SG34_002910 [Thalassomonas viridans]|uniref:Methylamine utilization protein n=1 Tax=Thalassomonas viridans TaxID=137584 RepID=A0AAE9Z3I7_9GAMM|nr:hypothetical protein [Thalassomonas viridans]WDE05898.1 hypothetical protein SG34_002910 [Thalassomonas viridans]